MVDDVVDERFLVWLDEEERGAIEPLEPALLFPLAIPHREDIMGVSRSRGPR